MMEKGRTIGEERFQSKKEEIDKYIFSGREFTVESILDCVDTNEYSKDILRKPLEDYVNLLKRYNGIEEVKVSETGATVYKSTELAEKLLLRI